MTSSGHVWELRGAWDVCTRCGVTLDRLLTAAPCRGVMAPTEPRDGEQSPTSDEREIDRLRLEVSELRRERDQLRFTLWGLTTELEGEIEELDRPRGGQQVTRITAFTCGMRIPSVASWVRRTARDLREVLDQGAAR